MRKIYDPMEFQPGMEQIDSDIFSRVIQARKQYQPEDYTAAQVKAALRKENLSFEDFAALLSPVSSRISRMPVEAMFFISDSISSAFSLQRVMAFLQLNPQ